ncbi:tyrosine-type recombinase/integrase [Desulfobaculum sp. SPO524]|uniref:tyrosine-type recombinase/integrase n=1 Tax=Desulfobaculum sp. SPO524 TaxID=3378071 RepID=UPI0038556430
MTGEIYSREKCPLCGGRLVHDPRRNGLFCQEHPKQHAQKSFYVKFGREVNRHFSTYEKALYFLNGLRFKTYEGTFDADDYQSGAPHAFTTLADAFLREKKHLKSYRSVRNHMTKAKAYFGDMNIKEIKRRHIRKFLFSLKVSDKTRFNYRSTLHHFFVSFLVDEEYIKLSDVPRFPSIDYELGYRNIVDIPTQNEIVEQVRENTWDLNPKIWLGIDILRTYISLRPDDLRRLTEEDVDARGGYLLIWRPTKTRGKFKRKTVVLMPDHVELIREMKKTFTAMPHLPFFRWHGGEGNNTRAGQPFGPKVFYKYWRKACSDIGVPNVDLYGGTRHSTTTALSLEVGRDSAKVATDHGTNKAFDRYCQAENVEAIRMSKVIQKIQGKVIKLKDKK